MKANKSKVLPLLKTAKGHIEGIINMVEEDRECMDIANQIVAVEALMRKANKVVLKAHILSCIYTIIEKKNNNEDIEELVSLFDRLMK